MDDPDSPHPLQMSDDELRDFLLGPVDTVPGQEMRFVAVASLRKDGSPWVVPLGYWYDGTYLYITMHPANAGVRRLRRDPRVSMTVFNTNFQARFVTVAGVAEEIEDPGHEISRRILGRAQSDHLVDLDAYERNWLRDGKVVFRVPVAQRSTMDQSKLTGEQITESLVHED